MSGVKSTSGRARRESVRRSGRQSRPILEAMEGRLLLSSTVLDPIATQIESFRTQPTAPVAVSPGAAASPGPVVSSTTPTFTWQAVAGAGGYEVHIFDTTLQKFSSYTVDASTTSFTPSAGALAPGDSFSWNVRTSSNVGV